MGTFDFKFCYGWEDAAFLTGGFMQMIYHLGVDIGSDYDQICGLR